MKISTSKLDSTGRVVTRWMMAIGVTSPAIGIWGFCRPFGFLRRLTTSRSGLGFHLGNYGAHLMRDLGATQIGLGLAAMMTSFQRSRDGAVALLGQQKGSQE